MVMVKSSDRGTAFRQPASPTHTQQSSTDTPITPERNRKATLPRLPRTLLSYCYTTSEARPPMSAAQCATNPAIHIYMAFLPDIIIYTKTDTPKRLARPNPSSTRPIAKNAFIRVLRGYTGQESSCSCQCPTARGRRVEDNPVHKHAPSNLASLKSLSGLGAAPAAVALFVAAVVVLMVGVVVVVEVVVAEPGH